MQHLKVQIRHQPTGEWQTYKTYEPRYETTLSRRRWLLFFVKHVPVIANRVEAERECRTVAWCTANKQYEAGCEVRIVYGGKTDGIQWGWPIWKDGKWLE